MNISALQLVVKQMMSVLLQLPETCVMGSFQTFHRKKNELRPTKDYKTLQKIRYCKKTNLHIKRLFWGNKDKLLKCFNAVSKTAIKKNLIKYFPTSVAGSLILSA